MTPTIERVHSDFGLAEIIKDIKSHLGIVLAAEAGHGKSYTAFSIVQEAMKDKDTTVIILSPSTIWRRNFGYIKYVKVGSSLFNPIIEKDDLALEGVPYLRDTIHINLDKKWIYQKSQWFENLITSNQHLLFEIKYKNGRRIKQFESIAIKAIYDYQERMIEENPSYKHHFLIVLEEVQNAFGTYSMNADDSLELFTMFTQSRSDANIHYLAIGQRLNDISTKVVERLRPMVGLTVGENSLRKIKAQLPDILKQRVQELPSRHWLYLDGKDCPEIVIPEYNKEGEPIQTLPYEAPIPMVMSYSKKEGFFSKLFAK
ncbi:MAG: ATP-binding protein [Crenarchaeota archaeon]|nr:ATP-binding protein [Thermoproteota archaeon]